MFIKVSSYNRRVRRIFQSHQGSLWSFPDFRLVAIARSASLIGDQIALTTLVLYFYDSGFDTRSVSVLLVAAAVPSILLAPVTGRIADTVDSRWITAACSFISAAVVVVMSILGSFHVMIILVVLLFVAQAFSSPAWTALTPKIVGEANIGRAIGTLQMLGAVALGVGPIIAGAMFNLWGPSLGFVLDAISFIFLGLAAVNIKTRRRSLLSLTGEGISERREWFLGFSSMRRDFELRSLVILLSCFTLGAQIINVVEVFLIRSAFQANSLAFGLIGSLTGVGIFIGAAVAARLQHGRNLSRGVVLGVLAVSLLTAYEGFVPTLQFTAAAFAVGGFAIGVLNTCFGTFVMLRTQEERRGEVAATINGVLQSAAVAGLILGGLFGGLTDPRTTFIVLGFSMFATSGVVVIGLRGSLKWLREREDTSPPNVAPNLEY